ncbi:hypothetical protein D9756_004124 [Leucocoprinus leucothites]|uniref:Uncharacterized protein n=1 Tax=Leucocoprinus leucothites TaxID=201217 RepID=A0A8H5D969_9AGAR|nr:hypothetical protein D9756_004124 [Leucoagaricus leucothites]
MMSIICFLALLLAPLVTAFSFSVGAPTECDSLDISWSGGSGPFFLHLIPVFSVPTNISIPANAVNDGQGSFSISQLPIAQGKEFLLVMSDATGFATGGTTSVLTVGPSKGGKCSTAEPTVAFSFQLNSALAQCQPYVFSGYPAATLPVSIFGIIPSGTSFALHPPAGATSFSWNANVERGTSIIFMMTDAAGRQGGASDLMVVANSNDRSCLNGLSPSSTSAVSTTANEQTTKKPTKTATSSSETPSASSSAPASSGGSSAGAIAGTVIGALLFLAVVITLGLFFLRKRREAKQLPATTSGFPSYGGGHTNGYSLSSTSNPAFAASSHSPYTPHTPQTYNPQTPYGTEQSYGHSYQPSQYAPSTYAPSAHTQVHNHSHTLSTGALGAYDGYQTSMLPYDANPFLDNPQHQQYPPANYAYQSTYQLPSASAYSLPHPVDPFNPPITDRGQPLPPLPPPTTDDPFASAENTSTAGSSMTAAQRKAAMAGASLYKSPSRIVVHTDAEDVLPPPNADGVVELPPQYTERRGGGLAVVNQSPPSPSSSVTPLPQQHQPPTASSRST